MRKLAAPLITAATALTFTVLPTVVGSSPEILSDDSAGWNCATMGNRVCGTPDGTLIYFTEAGNIWSTSDPVNGRPMCGTDAQCEQYAS